MKNPKNEPKEDTKQGKKYGYSLRKAFPPNNVGKRSTGLARYPPNAGPVL